MKLKMIIAPVKFVKSSLEFGSDELLPRDLLELPDESIYVYAWYVQGRDKDIEEFYSSKEFDGNFPPGDTVFESSSTSGKRVEIVDGYFKYVIETSYELSKITTYIQYEKIEKPDIDMNNIYYILFDLFILMNYYGVYHPAQFLEENIFNLFPISRQLFHPEVEIALAILSPNYYRNLRVKLRYVGGLTKPQSVRYFVSPNPQLQIQDYLEDIFNLIPYEWGIIIPDRFMDLKYISYPCEPIVTKQNCRYSPFIKTERRENRTIACGKQKLLKRMKKHAPWVLSEIIWRKDNAGIVLAGGFLQNCLSNEAYTKSLYKNSDIDLFIYGSSSDVIALMHQTIAILHTSGYIFDRIGYIINARKEGSNIIQIIPTNSINWYEIIYRFDNSAVQVAFDGDDIYCTPEFRHYTEYGLSLFYPPSLKPYRVIKSIDRGFDPVVHNMILHGNKPFSGNWKRYGNYIFSGERKLKVSKIPPISPTTYDVPVGELLLQSSVIIFKITSMYNGSTLGKLTLNNMNRFISYSPIIFRNRLDLRSKNRGTSNSLLEVVSEDTEIRTIVNAFVNNTDIDTLSQDTVSGHDIDIGGGLTISRDNFRRALQLSSQYDQDEIINVNKSLKNPLGIKDPDPFGFEFTNNIARAIYKYLDYDYIYRINTIWYGSLVTSVRKVYPATTNVSNCHFSASYHPDIGAGEYIYINKIWK